MAPPSVIFVGGCMRSGTTIAQRVVSSSTDAHEMVGESYYLAQQLNLHVETARSFEVRHKDFFGSLDRLDAFTQGIVQQFMDTTREQLGNVATLVLKNPELTAHFPRLYHWLPDARFVVVMRDPRDTIASILAVADKHRATGVASQLTSMGRDMRKMAGFFMRYYVEVLKVQQSMGDRLLILRYEALMNEPEQTIAELAGFLGIPITAADVVGDVDLGVPSAWLDPDKVRDEPFFDAFRSPLHRMGISPARVGKHTEQLSGEEITALETNLTAFNGLVPYW